jgi:hypothetical protein
MYQTIGFIGSGFYFIAYILLVLRKLRGDSLAYQALNILGGICLVINSTYTHDMPSVLTNAMWAGVGVFAIFYNRPR